MWQPRDRHVLQKLRRLRPYQVEHISTYAWSHSYPFSHLLGVQNCLSGPARMQVLSYTYRPAAQLHSFQAPQFLHLSNRQPFAQPPQQQSCCQSRRGPVYVQAYVTVTQGLASSDKVKRLPVSCHSSCCNRYLVKSPLNLCRISTATSCLTHLCSTQSAPEKVADVMTKKHVFTCKADTSIDEGTCSHLLAHELQLFSFCDDACSASWHWYIGFRRMNACLSHPED